MTDEFQAWIAERVVQAAAWLDEIQPDWRDRVDPLILDMDSPDDCVLGQVFAAEADEYGMSSGSVYAAEELALWGQPFFVAFVESAGQTDAWREELQRTAVPS